MYMLAGWPSTAHLIPFSLQVSALRHFQGYFVAVASVCLQWSRHQNLWYKSNFCANRKIWTAIVNTLVPSILNICWPCIIVYQDSETNVIHFLFSLLRIRGLYMFRTLLTHPEKALHKRFFVYCMNVISVGCTRINVGMVHFNPGAASCCNSHAIYPEQLV
jgi:hypothetical protein